VDCIAGIVVALKCKGKVQDGDIVAVSKRVILTAIGDIVYAWQNVGRNRTQAYCCGKTDTFCVCLVFYALIIIQRSQVTRHLRLCGVCSNV